MSSLSSNSSTEISSSDSSSAPAVKAVKKNRPATVKVKATKFRCTGLEDDEIVLPPPSRIPEISLELLLCDFSSINSPEHEATNFSSSNALASNDLPMKNLDTFSSPPSLEAPFQVVKIQRKKVYFADNVGISLVEVHVFDRDAFEENTLNDVKGCTQHFNEGIYLKNPIGNIDDDDTSSSNKSKNVPAVEQKAIVASNSTSRSTFVSSAPVYNDRKEGGMKSLSNLEKPSRDQRPKVIEIPEAFLLVETKRPLEKEISQKRSSSHSSYSHHGHHSSDLNRGSSDLSRHSSHLHLDRHSHHSSDSSRGQYNGHHSSDLNRGRHSSHSHHDHHSHHSSDSHRGHHTNHLSDASRGHHSSSSHHDHHLNHSHHSRHSSHSHCGSSMKKYDYGGSSGYGKRYEKDYDHCEYRSSSKLHHHHDRHHPSPSPHYSSLKSYNKYESSGKSHGKYRQYQSPPSRSSSFRTSPYEKDYYRHHHQRHQHSRERSYSPQRRQYSHSVSRDRY